MRTKRSSKTPAGSRRRRVVLHNGHIVGGVFVGEGEVARTVSKVLTDENELESVLAVL